MESTTTTRETPTNLGPPRSPDTSERDLATTLERGRVLVVDDDDATCEIVERMLDRHDLTVDACVTPNEALRRASETHYDAILTDLEMGGMHGLELIKRLREHQREAPIIVVTGHGSFENAVSAMRVGAYDFLTKPLDPKLLGHATLRAVERSRLHREVRRLQGELDRTKRFDELLGGSRAMQRVFDLVSRVADTETNVLITGESGTGKELVARALHRQSARAERPFVAVNCAAVPANLIESELFGHVRGAFTDARRERTGLFLEAHSGTIFLDEVGELPLELQPKLLRVLQEREVRPVGGDGTKSFDARVVCATNADLEAEVAAGRFREDLYYRINVVRVGLPPLRDRGSDVLRLATHFIDLFAERNRKSIRGMTENAAEKLLAYDWPGNVRELENCIECAVALTRSDQVTFDDLPASVRSHRNVQSVEDLTEAEQFVPLNELENRYLRRVLRSVDGNKALTARILGIDRRTLYRKLDRMNAEAAS